MNEPGANPSIDPRFERLRDRMVRKLIKKGINDDAVLQAMGSVPRELFVPRHLRADAYADRALPIEKGQTISQPFVVAMMASALNLKSTDRVLDVGTGSGYAAAVISLIAQEVFSVEVDVELADTARQRLAALGYRNVHVKNIDGSFGWAEHAPFDAISVAAAASKIPEQLLLQLKIRGRMVIPLGESDGAQMLTRVIRTDKNEFKHDNLGEVRFVPFVLNHEQT